MNVAVITIGNRDVAIKDNKKIDDLKECRLKGEYILQNYKKLKDKIEFPIIQPFLNDIEVKGEKIKQFILIATDQDNERYRNKDSINFAKIIKKHLLRKYQDISVKIISLKRNINNYAKNYEFFQKKLKSFSDIEEIDRFYILPVGGMPNINGPLILTSILFFKDKVYQFYVDEIQSHVLPIPFAKKFLSELEKEKIIPALEKFFFATVSNLTSRKFVKDLAEYAYHRLSFNLKKAKILIDDMILNYPDEDVNIFSATITEINNNLNAKFREIFFSAIIKIKQKQFVDALLRLYNFTDNILLEKVCKLYEIELDFKKNFDKEWKKAVKKIIKKNPEIIDNLEKINGESADLNRSGIPLYISLIKYKNKNDSIFEIIKPLQSILGLRNKSIAAHGFNGVSLENINEKLEQHKLNLNDLIKKIEDYLNTSFEVSVYVKIKKLIEKHL